MAQQMNQQQQQQQQRPQPQEDRYVSKVRELVGGPLKDKWQETLKEASNKLLLNGIQDSGTGTPKSVDGTAFESSLEDFFAICDQVEANLKTAIEVHHVSSASHRYMTIMPCPSKLDLNTPPPGNPANVNPEFLSYPQYIQTAKHQVKFANDMRQQLSQAAHEVVNNQINQNKQENKQQ